MDVSSGKAATQTLGGVTPKVDPTCTVIALRVEFETMRGHVYLDPPRRLHTQETLDNIPEMERCLAYELTSAIKDSKP